MIEQTCENCKYGKLVKTEFDLENFTCEKKKIFECQYTGLDCFFEAKEGRTGK